MVAIDLLLWIERLREAEAAEGEKLQMSRQATDASFRTNILCRLAYCKSKQSKAFKGERVTDCLLRLRDPT
jgi:hypothetical protein